MLKASLFIKDYIANLNAIITQLSKDTFKKMVFIIAWSRNLII